MGFSVINIRVNLAYRFKNVACISYQQISLSEVIIKEALFLLRTRIEMTTIDLSKLDVEKCRLDTPSLEKLCRSIFEGLVKNYAHVTVEIVDCPDLREEPFNLASQGLCGNVTVVQVGDPAYLFPTVLKNKLYDFRDVAKALDLNPCFMFGAGGGPWPSVGTFSEIFANVRISDDCVRNNSKDIYLLDADGDKIRAKSAPPDETRFACVTNLCASLGEPGKVIHIKCKQRLGLLSFPTVIQETLKSTFNTPLAFGIVFQLRSGTAKHHIFPKIPSYPLNSSDELKEYMFYHHLSAPFISVGTIVTKNPPNWSVSNQHFHSFDGGNKGGHYYEDITPDDTEYVAYMVPAETLCTIDKSENPICLADFKIEH